MITGNYSCIQLELKNRACLLVLFGYYYPVNGRCLKYRQDIRMLPMFRKNYILGCVRKTSIVIGSARLKSGGGGSDID